MGTIIEPEPAKLFVGMLAARPEWLDEAEKLLAERYGPVDVTSPVIPFDRTDYYREEMGTALKRKFISFDRLIAPDDLIDIKRTTNEIENDFAQAVKKRETGDCPPGAVKGTVPCFPLRPVNLDPGYLDLSKVVLATTKDYSHRLYLGRGIYAEVTLHYHAGKYEPWPWTYPDYRTAAYGEFFLEVRERLGRSRRTRR